MDTKSVDASVVRITVIAVDDQSDVLEGSRIRLLNLKSLKRMVFVVSVFVVPEDFSFDVVRVDESSHRERLDCRVNRVAGKKSFLCVFKSK